jgi:hypothetical protein
MTKTQELYSLAAYYKADHFDEGGFSITITGSQADAVNAALEKSYAAFKSMSPTEQKRSAAMFPKVLADAKVCIPEGQPSKTEDQNTIFRGLMVIYVMEKEGLLVSDQYNGMEYHTMGEVNQLKAVLAQMQNPATRAGVTILDYSHEDTCPKLKGGACNCKADMRVMQYAAGR